MDRWDAEETATDRRITLEVDQDEKEDSMNRTAADDRTAERAIAAKRKVEQFVTGVKDQAYKLKSKSFEDLWGNCVGYARDNPGKTIGASLVAGIMLGVWLRRRGE